MKNITIKQYPNYQHGAAGISFSHYFEGSRDWLHKYEPLLDYVKTKISSNIHTIINFGCASGRDFIPFQDTYNCVGFDIAPPGVISWVCKTDNLTYYECSIEDFILNINNFSFDWPNTLVYTQGTLMYVSPEIQNFFVESLLSKGCTNMVFQEYEPGNSGPNPCLDLNENNLKIFSKAVFRDNTTAHIFLK